MGTKGHSTYPTRKEHPIHSLLFPGCCPDHGADHAVPDPQRAVFVPPPALKVHRFALAKLDTSRSSWLKWWSGTRTRAQRASASRRL